MPVVRVDIHPADDPNGAPVASFTDDDLKHLSIRATREKYEDGHGRIVVNRHHADADELVPGRFARVYFPEIDPDECHFMFELTEDEAVLAAPTNEREDLRFMGPGPMGYVDRALLDEDADLGGSWAPADDGFWHIDQGKYTDVLDQMLDEEAATTHPALPDLTKDFTFLLDSDGNASTEFADEIAIRIGTGYAAAMRIIAGTDSDFALRVGLGTQAAPTMVLQAYNQLGEDRTGSAHAAGVVRLHDRNAIEPEQGSNVLNELVRRGRGRKRGTHAVVEGADGLIKRVERSDWTPPEPVRKVYLSAPHLSSLNDLERYGQRALKDRERAQEAVEVEIAPGDDELNGSYLPFKHFRPYDRVTVDTGSDNRDFTDRECIVHAIRVELVTSKSDTADEAHRSLRVVVELNTRTGSTQPVPSGVTNDAECCAFHGGRVPRPCPGAQTVETSTAWKVYAGGSPPAGFGDAGYDDSALPSAVAAPNGANYDGTSSRWIWSATGNRPDGEERSFRREFRLTDAPAGASLLLSADNGCEVYINGTLVASYGEAERGAADTPTFNWAQARGYRVDPALFVAGDNCISLIGWNEVAGVGSDDPDEPGPAGVYAVLTINPEAGTSRRYARCDHGHLIEDLATVETDTALVLHPDGEGGVEWGADSGSTVTDPMEAIRRHTHGIFVASYHRDSDQVPVFMQSLDGITWTDIDQSWDAALRDTSIIHWDGKWWMVGTGGTDTFPVYYTPDLALPFTYITNVTSDASATNTWAPEWIRNMDGSPYLHPSTGLPCLTVNVSTNNESTFTVREIHPTNRGMTSWSGSTTITGTSLPTKMIDGFLLVDGDDYWLWYKDESSKHIEIAHSSTALTSGYTVLEDGDWAGWFANKAGGANSIEGPCVVRLDDGRWRIYFNENNGLSSIRTVYSETTDDWRTGTSTWTTQATLTTDALMGHGSVLLIPGTYDHARDPEAHADVIADAISGIVTDHGALTGLADDDHTHYLTNARHAALDHEGLTGIPSGSPYVTVDPGTVTYDDTGPDVQVAIAAKWGYDGANPYFNDAGVTAGEEAALVFDPETRDFAVVPYQEVTP